MKEDIQAVILTERKEEVEVCRCSGGGQAGGVWQQERQSVLRESHEPVPNVSPYNRNENTGG